MKKRGRKINLTLLVIVVAVVLISYFFGRGNVSLSPEVGEISHSIQKIYGPLQSIVGWVNISFNDESANSVLSDDFGNSIILIDMLRNSEGYDFECNIEDCESDYAATSPQTSKIFYLRPNQKKIYGFKLTGNVESISSIDFEISSNAPSSCKNQLNIDILNDEIQDYANDKASEAVCGKSYGCYDSSTSSETYSLDFSPYCQKIDLDISPGFKIGALVKKDHGANSLKMNLYNSYGENIEAGNCDLTDPINSDWQEISCDIDYLVLEKESYYVCILSEGSEGNYKIRGYSDSDGCGFHGRPKKSEVASYKIFAQPKGFDAIGELRVSNQAANGETLSAKAQDYITSLYGDGIDCIDGCIIPISFQAGAIGQDIELKNLELKYSKTSGVVTESNFYNLQETPAKINSEYGKLYLDNSNFSVPSDYGKENFVLRLNGAELFHQKITIEKIPEIRSLSPLSLPAGVPTNFVVDARTSSGSLTDFQWDFGDGEIKETKTNSIIYKYNKTGSYELKIQVTDENKKSSERTFEINVNSPKDFLNKTIFSELENLNFVKDSIESFSPFEQKILNELLDLESVESELTSFQRKCKTQASEDSEYIEIAEKLIELKIPREVWESKTLDSTKYYFDKKNIDLSLIEEIGKGSYSEKKSEEYKDAILSWNQENIEAKIDFKEISVRFSKDEPLVRFFKFTISENNEKDKEVFLIFPNLENLEFEDNYGERTEGEENYIVIDEFPETISFSTTEDVDFTDIDAYLSPSLSEITISENGNEEPKSFNWALFIMVVILLIIISVVIYLFMYNWYKRNYENYLFKNKNNLYNIMSYIKRSKMKGESESTIYKSLKKSGWASEQAKYAMKKYFGKKTGMFEIPLAKFLKRKK